MDNLEIIKDSITQKFKRYIGKSLEILDSIRASEDIKHSVKSNLWYCHDDIQMIVENNFLKKQLDKSTDLS